MGWDMAGVKLPGGYAEYAENVYVTDDWRSGRVYHGARLAHSPPTLDQAIPILRASGRGGLVQANT